MNENKILKKIKSKSVSQEEDENDVQWMEYSANLAGSDSNFQSNSNGNLDSQEILGDFNINETNNVNIGTSLIPKKKCKTKKRRSSFSSTPSSKAKSRTSSSDTPNQRNASICNENSSNVDKTSSLLMTLMQGILETFDIQQPPISSTTSSSPKTPMSSLLSMTPSKVANAHSSLLHELVTSENMKHMNSKEIEDFTEDDFAMIEKAILEKFGNNNSLAKKSAVKITHATIDLTVESTNPQSSSLNKLSDMSSTPKRNMDTLAIKQQTQSQHSTTKQKLSQQQQSKPSLNHGTQSHMTSSASSSSSISNNNLNYTQQLQKATINLNADHIVKKQLSQQSSQLQLPLKTPNIPTAPVRSQLQLPLKTASIPSVPVRAPLLTTNKSSIHSQPSSSLKQNQQSVSVPSNNIHNTHNSHNIHSQGISQSFTHNSQSTQLTQSLQNKTHTNNHITHTNNVYIQNQAILPKSNASANLHNSQNTNSHNIRKPLQPIDTNILPQTQYKPQTKLSQNNTTLNKTTSATTSTQPVQLQHQHPSQSYMSQNITPTQTQSSSTISLQSQQHHIHTSAPSAPPPPIITTASSTNMSHVSHHSQISQSNSNCTTNNNNTKNNTINSSLINTSVNHVPTVAVTNASTSTVVDELMSIDELALIDAMESQYLLQLQSRTQTQTQTNHTNITNVHTKETTQPPSQRSSHLLSQSLAPRQTLSNNLIVNLVSDIPMPSNNNNRNHNSLTEHVQKKSKHNELSVLDTHNTNTLNNKTNIYVSKSLEQNNTNNHYTYNNHSNISNDTILCHELVILHIEIIPFTYPVSVNQYVKRLYCYDSHNTHNSDNKNDNIPTIINNTEQLFIVDLYDTWIESEANIHDIITVIELNSSHLTHDTNNNSNSNNHMDALYSWILTLPRWSPSISIAVNSNNNCADKTNNLTTTLVTNTSIINSDQRDNSSLKSISYTYTHLAITNTSNLLILHPDILVSPTKITEACQCVRRSVVSERAKSVFSASSTAAVIGNLKHDFIEKTIELYLADLKQFKSCQNMYKQFPNNQAYYQKFQELSNLMQKWHSIRSVKDFEPVNKLAKLAMSNNLIELYCMNMTDETVEFELNRVVGLCVAWVDELQSQSNNNHLLPQVHNNNRNNNSNTNQTINQQKSNQNINNITIESVVELEETLWSSFLGLKGKIDIVALGGSNNKSSSILIPIELKTGKWKASLLPSHRAQVILYLLSMLLRDKGFTATSHTSTTAVDVPYTTNTNTNINTAHLAYTQNQSQYNDSHSSALSSVNYTHWPMSPSPASLTGLLLYMGGDDSHQPQPTKTEMIIPTWAEVKALIHMRNTLSSYMHHTPVDHTHTFPIPSLPQQSEKQQQLSIKTTSSTLPPLLKNPRECSFCFQAAECMIYLAALEGVGNKGYTNQSNNNDKNQTTESKLNHNTNNNNDINQLSNNIFKEIDPNLSELYDFTLRNVSESHLAYIRHWESMLDMEESALIAKNGSRSFWVKQQLQSQHFYIKSVNTNTESNNNSNGKGVLNNSYGCLRQLSFVKCEPYVSVDNTNSKSSSCSHLFHLHLSNYNANANATNTNNKLTSGGGGGGIQIGDRIMISLEKIINNPMSESSISTTTVTAPHTVTLTTTQTSITSTGCYEQDLEDYGIGATQTTVTNDALAVSHPTVPVNNRTAPTVTVTSNANNNQNIQKSMKHAYEPHTALGIVLAMDYHTNNIIIELNAYPKRLVEMSSRPGVYIRLDTHEIAAGISSMRSCLLSMFITSHEPKTYEEWKRVYNSPLALAWAESNISKNNQSVTSNSNSNGNISSDIKNVSEQLSLSFPSGCRKLRELIVDMKPPSFRSSDTLPEDIHMFLPPGMDLNIYKQSLIILEFYAHELEQLLKMNMNVNESSNSISNNISHSSLPINQQQSSIDICRYQFLSLIDFGYHPDMQIRVDIVSKIISFPDGLVIYPGCNPYQLYKEYQSCNIYQKVAIRKVLLCEDYTLLHGYPGTGKTQCIALLIRILIAMGQKVLISAYTHSAVDNILMKLCKSGVLPSIAKRVTSGGNSYSDTSYIHSSVQPYLLHHTYYTNTTNNTDDKYEKEMISLNNLRFEMSNVRLVACTALTAYRNPLVKSIRFDISIVDEAGQIIEPNTIGVLMMSERKFVLVGDHYQLPPLVLSQAAKTKGMDISLFRRLYDKFTATAVVSLNQQYRMNKDIASLCGYLFYNNKLECGSDDIANAKLRLPDWNDLLINKCLSFMTTTATVITATGERIQSTGLRNEWVWLYQALDPSNSVIFLDTDTILPIPSSNTSTKVTSTTTTSTLEAQIIHVLLYCMHQLGLNVLDAVGVITPYRAQIKTIYHALNQQYLSVGTSQIPINTHTTHIPTTALPLGKNNPKSSVLAQVEVTTVDKFQGRDMNVIILSTVHACMSGTSKVGHNISTNESILNSNTTNTFPSNNTDNNSNNNNSSNNSNNNFNSIGEILKDWRRLNVALSRAKTKLIIIGSYQLLSTSNFDNNKAMSSDYRKGFPELCDLVRSRGWIASLPIDLASQLSNSAV